MSDNTQQPGGEGAPRDPWAPPDNRVDLGKQPMDAVPPAVHNQPTVTSMPSPDSGNGPIPGPTGAFGPQQPPVPAPPVGPNGPGQPGYPSAPAAPSASYGYPSEPAAPAASYGYPSAPAAPSASYGYPGYPGYGGQQPWGPAPANGLGIAAMVLGIIAVVGFCMYGLGVVLGVLALIFGIIGRGRARRGEASNGGMALAGIILGSIGIVISAVFLGFIIWAIANDESGSGYDYDDPYSTSLVVGTSR
ncbi:MULTISPECIES: DUF4190 domain-containing protein [Streptomyces]|uniref:DUF4190 domain-containing protein n=1 Tax=Streptomyces mutomycini TaxID=284036 RepID=A0ABW0BBE9_9ACTN|nr:MULTISPECIES: DUF4190 domain-containing protein [Streptomyces]KPC83737.1 integral membrane protein [Streptomyces sp. NRRL S-4]